MATPLVSFTAALLKATLDPTPEQIKRRLIAASDIFWEVREQVADGQGINPIKALAVREDIVEHGDGSLYFGNAVLKSNGADLRPIDNIDLNCGDDKPSIRVSDLMKIRLGLPHTLPWYIRGGI